MSWEIRDRPKPSCPNWKIFQGQLAKASPRVRSWSTARSPPFPTTWPPSAKTAWVRYQYAWGMDSSIADGVMLGAPWCREELGVAGEIARFEATEKAGSVLGIQGVAPLPGPGTSALDVEQGDALFRRAFALRALPSETGAPGPISASELRAFYGPWVRRNGVLAGALEAEHGDFLAWARE